jgi:5-methylcytosine-specific restriction endonuclease McrA
MIAPLHLLYPRLVKLTEERPVPWNKGKSFGLIQFCSRGHDKLVLGHWAGRCKQCIRDSKKKLYKNNICLVCKKKKALKISCASCRVEYKNAYRKNQYWDNRDKNIRAAVEWGRKNKDKRRVIVSKYQKAHPEMNRLACSIYSFRRRRFPGVGDTGFTVQEWNAVVKKFNDSCAYCRRNDVKLTIDHVVPLSKGGSIGIENIVPACRPCNSKKGNRPVEMMA